MHQVQAEQITRLIPQKIIKPNRFNTMFQKLICKENSIQQTNIRKNHTLS